LLKWNWDGRMLRLLKPCMDLPVTGKYWNKGFFVS